MKIWKPVRISALYQLVDSQSQLNVNECGIKLETISRWAHMIRSTHNSLSHHRHAYRSCDNPRIQLEQGVHTECVQDAKILRDPDPLMNRPSLVHHHHVTVIQLPPVHSQKSTGRFMPVTGPLQPEIHVVYSTVWLDTA